MSRQVKYGKPADAGKPYIAEFYCAMHNGIPVHRWGKHELAPVDVLDLTPMQIMTIKIGGNEKSSVIMMVCRRCIVNIRKQLIQSTKLPPDEVKRVLRQMREDGEKGIQE